MTRGEVYNYDDNVSWSGTLNAGPVSVALEQGSGCHIKYTGLPFVVDCTVTGSMIIPGMNMTTGNPSITMELGIVIDSEALQTGGEIASATVRYRVITPETKIPVSLTALTSTALAGRLLDNDSRDLFSWPNFADLTSWISDTFKEFSDELKADIKNLADDLKANMTDLSEDILGMLAEDQVLKVPGFAFPDDEKSLLDISINIPDLERKVCLAADIVSKFPTIPATKMALFARKAAGTDVCFRFDNLSLDAIANGASTKMLLIAHFLDSTVQDMFSPATFAKFRGFMGIQFDPEFQLDIGKILFAQVTSDVKYVDAEGTIRMGSKANDSTLNAGKRLSPTIIALVAGTILAFFLNH